MISAAHGSTVLLGGDLGEKRWGLRTCGWNPRPATWGLISRVRKRHLPVSSVGHMFESLNLACHEQGLILKPTTRGRPGEVFGARNRCWSPAVGQFGRVACRGFSSVKLLESVVKEMNSSCRQLLFHGNANFHTRQQETRV